MFDRIILGTANFAKEYNGVKVKDVDAILEYAKEIGIYALDTAVAYETHHLDYPRKIVKLQDGDVFMKSPQENKPLCLMAHNTKAYKHTIRESERLKLPLGLSIYDAQCLNDIADTEVAPHVIQVPYSVFDRRAEQLIRFLAETGVEVHARSIFLRGKVLENTTPFRALAFVLFNPCVHKVVVGTESLQMLQDTLEPLRDLQDGYIEDEEILDPRRWK
jgi:aryl-alcohol dehydrogenase-like predicted oxidoreductase